ncbi:MFS transporter [Aeromicrobium choanae]|uniref:MFS transporter, DHA1 family, inner membrane transport protein n=1 Tax=Aeromicrobium choanae TaxID=1736691 RepID=A0A1T4Z2X0_9ACTN|nr:MFS transporter [Aeromicrobium choanae]SKB08213.1 MFS transporter, DHA1 family, inner membrane transport protein [Aeromicrobium choanae]
MTSTRTEPTARARHVGLALLALALGGFAIGTTEFVTMGLLPDVAESIDRDIPTTGHIISAYALGVVVGAPLIVSLAARMPKRALLLWLLAGLGVGNALTAVASGYLPVLLARFVAGLPHGAYFGVASLVAASLVPAGRRGRAVSMVMMGLSVATVAGVPASTWLGQAVSWRAAYALVVVIAAVAALLVLAFVPHLPGDPSATIRSELGALREPAVIAAFATGVVGFGGIFAMYSYIAPIVTDVVDLPSSVIPVFLLVFGLGSVSGTWIAGRLADWDNVRQVIGGLGATVVVLLAFYELASFAPAALLCVFLVGALGSVVAIGLQIRLMSAAGDAQMLGAALNHASLNIANGLGAWLGGLVIAAGAGYAAPALVGVALAAAGLVAFLVGLRVAPVRTPVHA